MRRLSIQLQLIIVVVVALSSLAVILQIINAFQKRDALVEADRDRSLVLIGSVNTTIDAVQPFIRSIEDITELNTRLNRLVNQNDNVEFIALTRLDGQVIFHSDSQYVGRIIDPLANFSTTETLRDSVSGFGSVYLTAVQISDPALEGTYQLVVGTPTEPIDDEVQSTVVFSAGVTLGAVIVFSLLLIVVLRFSLIQPVRRLSEFAETIQRGDLSVRVPATRRGDEIGRLTNALNDTASQLESLVENLEDRVAAGTRDLQTVVDVSARVATILSVEQMLQDVVDLTKERFDLYHAQIYLLDESKQQLVLAAGAGYVGEVMVAEGETVDLQDLISIPARAARSMKGTVVNDVLRSVDFQPHRLLPDVRSEAAIALVARGQLLGVLDVQSTGVGHFTDDLYAILEVMATQVATALNNASLFETTSQIVRHERALGNISRSIEGATSVEAVLETTVRELGKALRVPYTAIELQLKD